MNRHEDDKVWSRWEEFLTRVQKLLEVADRMSSIESGFLVHTERRLTRYEQHTTLSRRQRNWLTHLEAEYLEPTDAAL